MSWVIFSAISPFLLALVSIVDDYLSRRTFKDKAFVYVFSGAIFLLISSASIFLFHPESRAVPLQPALILMGVGAFLMMAFISLYILAMQRSGASIVVPVFQTIPVFVFIGGYIFFGETISTLQMIACAVIIAAAIAITWDFGAKKIDLVSLAIMLGACVGASSYMLCSRYYTQQFDPYTILAYIWTGFGGLSLILLLASESRRDVLVKAVKAAPGIVLSGLVAQAVLQTFAEICIVSALKTAPAAGLVQTMGGMQPAYVLIIFAALGFIAPRHYQKIPVDRVLAWKIGCIIILFAGVAVISLSGHE